MNSSIRSHLDVWIKARNWELELDNTNTGVWHVELEFDIGFPTSWNPSRLKITPHQNRAYPFPY
jgi:hypothetical protein